MVQETILFRSALEDGPANPLGPWQGDFCTPINMEQRASSSEGWTTQWRGRDKTPIRTSFFWTAIRERLRRARRAQRGAGLHTEAYASGMGQQPASLIPTLGPKHRHPCLRVQLLLPRARISSVRPTRPRSPAGWSRLGPAARIYPHIIQPSTNRDRISRRDPSELTLWPSAVWTRKPRRCSLPLTRPIAVFVYPGLHSNFPGRTIGPL